MTDTALWKTGIMLGTDAGNDAVTTAKLDPEIKSLFEANKFDAVEEVVLARIESNPGDLNFFIPIFRHFVRNNRTEPASAFLELMLDGYRNRKAEKEELAFLRSLFAVWPDMIEIRTLLLKHLKEFYHGSPNFNRLVEHCKLVQTDNPQAAFKLFEIWLRFDEGRGVYLPAKGVGRVREINLNLSILRVFFPSLAETLTFKPDEAFRMLEALAPGHFLLETIDKPDELRKLAQADAGALLQRLFTSLGREIPLSELKTMLVSIVEPSKWSSWWTQAKKDRRLTVTKGNVCSWNDSAEDADSALFHQFLAAPVKERLEIAKKFAKRSPKLAAKMTEELLRDARNEHARNGALALELFLSIEKLPAKSEDTSETIAELIRRNDILEQIGRLSDRILRKRALSLIREHRADWQSLYAGLIKTESDAQSITMLYESLQENDPDLADSIAGEAMLSPTQSPEFYLWLCRELIGRPELDRFANWNFLQQVYQLLSKNMMREQNAAFRKLFDEDGSFHEVARRLDTDQAKQLISQLDRDSSLEDYRREKMIKDLKAWYPQTVEVKDNTFFVSSGALKLRQDEFARITTVDIPQNTEEIMKARAHGDLRENFEYHAARARQEMLSSRAKTLHDELQLARPIDFSRIDPSTVCIGTAIRAKELGGSEELTITVMGPWDSDPSSNVLSYLAPAAAGILGKRTGDAMEYNGKQYTIAAITVAPQK